MKTDASEIKETSNEELSKAVNDGYMIALNSMISDECPGLEMYGVGQVIPEFKGKESSGISIDGPTIEIHFAFNNLNEKEKELFSKGTFQAKLVCLQGVIFFIVRFGNGPWSDIAYTAHLSPGVDETMLPENYGVLLIVAEATTGEVQSLRYVSMNKHFSSTLNKLIKEQKSKLFDMENHFRAVSEVYSRYSTKQMVKFAF